MPAAGKAGQYSSMEEKSLSPTSAAVASASAVAACESSGGGGAVVRVLAFAGLALNSHCSV